MALTREQMKALIDELPDEQLNELSGYLNKFVTDGPQSSYDSGEIDKEIKFQFPPQEDL